MPLSTIILDAGSNLIGQVELSDGTHVIGVPSPPVIISGPVMVQDGSGNPVGSNGGALDASLYDGAGNPIGSTVSALTGKNTLNVSLADGGGVPIDSANVSSTNCLRVIAAFYGWTTTVFQSLSDTPQDVTGGSASGPNFGGYTIFNPNTDPCFVFWYNSATPTVGSPTNLSYLVCVPAGATIHTEFVKAAGIFSDVMYVAASSSATSDVAPTVPLVATILWGSGLS